MVPPFLSTEGAKMYGNVLKLERGKGSKMDEYGQFCVLKMGRGGGQKSLSISACSPFSLKFAFQKAQ